MLSVDLSLCCCCSLSLFVDSLSSSNILSDSSFSLVSSSLLLDRRCCRKALRERHVNSEAFVYVVTTKKPLEAKELHQFADSHLMK